MEVSSYRESTVYREFIVCIILNLSRSGPQTQSSELSASKQELNIKESKDKGKKDEKTTKDETTGNTNANNKKNKLTDRNEAAKFGGKLDKLATPNVALKPDSSPEYLLFASFNGTPAADPDKHFVELKKDTLAAGKLRQFGLLRSLPHPVHISVVRNCPLIPPPTPVQIPRWKLIRQKKKIETSEPSLHPKKIKEPKFVELKTPFLNYKVGLTPVPSATRFVILYIVLNSVTCV